MIIRTANGPVCGERRDSVAVFRGIPYGTAQRFMPPQPAAAWEEVRDCTRNGPIAVQHGGSISGSEGLGPYFSGGRPQDFGAAQEVCSEDCLVLNVLTPLNAAADAPRGGRPVLVYIHGGGFSSGSGTLVIGAHRFVQEQDVVLVGVNHRLNVFGYLYLEHLDKKYAGSGMAGMLDLVLALQWVQQNIAAFGGDPAQVTIMGESGGGMKISTLLAMPAAAGLFCRAIVESGSAPVGTYLPQQAQKTAAALLQELGLAPEEYAALETIPAEELLDAFEAVCRKDHSFMVTPVADGTNLAPNPAESFAAPEISRNIPLMVGSSEDEMGVFTPHELLRSITWENLAEILQNAPAHRCKGDAVEATVVEKRIAAVRAASPADISPAHLYLHIVSMGSFLGGGAFHQAMAKAEQGGAPVYHYVVNYDSPLPDMEELRCSWHTADLPLQLRVVLHPESEALSQTMAAAVGAFVRSGDPSTPALAWPAFTPAERLTMVFDEPSRVESDPWCAVREAME